jgi:hypothetical protein
MTWNPARATALGRPARKFPYLGGFRLGSPVCFEIQAFSQAFSANLVTTAIT